MEYFKEELQTICNDNVREYTQQVLERVNDKFFHAPASSSGKYHPKYTLGDGGLYRHTRAAVKIANSLLETTTFNNFASIQCDYIRAALILHDTCKSGIDWTSEHTCFEHPAFACDLIFDTLKDNSNESEQEYQMNVTRLIACHMGEWNTSKYSTMKLPVPISDDEIFVHLCDYLASRKFIEINFEEN